jgi:hypothetical protein
MKTAPMTWLNRTAMSMPMMLSRVQAITVTAATTCGNPTSTGPVEKSTHVAPGNHWACTSAPMVSPTRARTRAHPHQ